MSSCISQSKCFKYKKGAPLKQIFNINLGIGIIKKTTFSFVFLTYLPVFLLKFRSGEFVGCGIKFHIQQVATRHTFYGPLYPKNNKYLKKCDAEFNYASNELSQSKFEKRHMEICRKYEQKSSFFMIPIPKFILKNCLRGAPFFIFKAF